jgi:NAD(P)-dependent dehydrogenase (short-subunit alcohol dehydrogenase family)
MCPEGRPDSDRPSRSSGAASPWAGSDSFLAVPTVLVTGAARGIGRATALRLAEQGWQVFAGVRRDQDGEELARGRTGQITPLLLDITDERRVHELAGALPAHLDALVNNAGIVVGGPLEAVPLAELRRQLEVNVIGQLAVTQALLPRLRSSAGRIVFVSSLSGRVSTPLTGAYNASKFALEAMADALRMELAPWGIRVVLIEPAQTNTDMWRLADDDLDRTVAQLAPEHRELYAKHIAGFRRMIPRSQRMARPADEVATTVQRALTDRRPRARYVVGNPVRVQAILARLTPTPVLDVMLRAGTGVPRRP